MLVAGQRRPRSLWSFGNPPPRSGWNGRSRQTGTPPNRHPSRSRRTRSATAARCGPARPCSRRTERERERTCRRGAGAGRRSALRPGHTAPAANPPPPSSAHTARADGRPSRPPSSPRLPCSRERSCARSTPGCAPSHGRVRRSGSSESSSAKARLAAASSSMEGPSAGSGVQRSDVVFSVERRHDTARWPMQPVCSRPEEKPWRVPRRAQRPRTPRQKSVSPGVPPEALQKRLTKRGQQRQIQNGLRRPPRPLKRRKPGRPPKTATAGALPKGKAATKAPARLSAAPPAPKVSKDELRAQVERLQQLSDEPAYERTRGQQGSKGRYGPDF